ncbi:protein of unknown function [Taphrina deformans PYCC 5710]|uniref:Uncharacterized protein n=1 Tax=Taphrina deformans (strain PYCC 5710 / ATCC 11124 / CBS 356.35 / IMI 108563 / JCM 9778 / NBRC 8474) TaxID=1097556 RepID=R4XBZ6_TAPDE|nr:protein of unknown function [Taphrina deformans PYCC 5710]|eukprot:CCG83397.1 protein of unknown function [Taphrina deformans PYCC 5710]
MALDALVELGQYRITASAFAGMAMLEVARRNRIISLLLLLITSYVLISTLTTVPVPSPRSLWTTSDTCATANHRWRGANDRIFPKSGASVSITHKDYSDGLVNHDVSVLLAHSNSEEYSITVEVFTSHPIEQGDFQINYSHDELILSTLVAKGSSLLNDKKSRGSGHCFVIKVTVLIPTSKPLSGLKVNLPSANFYIHESAAGAMPYLDVSIGRGSIIMAPHHRVHVESLRFEVLKGAISGSVLLTNSLLVFLQHGSVDLDIDFSPYLVGAEVQVTQESGSQQVLLNDLFYRPVTGTYSLARGTIDIHYPKSYSGRLLVDLDQGRGQVSGNGLQIIDQTENPYALEARQGVGMTTTKVHVGSGRVVMRVDDPGTFVPELIE